MCIYIYIYVYIYIYMYCVCVERLSWLRELIQPSGRPKNFLGSAGFGGSMELMRSLILTASAMQRIFAAAFVSRGSSSGRFRSTWNPCLGEALVALGSLSSRQAVRGTSWGLPSMYTPGSTWNVETQAGYRR